MKKFAIVISLIVAVIVLFATLGRSQAPATPKPAEPTAPKPVDKPLPTLNGDQKAAFFKAQSQLLQAQTELSNAQKSVQDKTTAYQAAIGELSKTCGETAQPQLVPPNGDLQCVAKPPAPKAGEKK